MSLRASSSLVTAGRGVASSTLQQRVVASSVGSSSSSCSSIAGPSSSSSNPRRFQSSWLAASKPSSDSAYASEFAPLSGQPANALPPLARRDATLYYTLLPHEASTLNTLLARLQLPTNDTEIATQLSVALTHPSWIPLRDAVLGNDYRRRELGTALAEALSASQQAAQRTLLQDNAALSNVGNDLLGMITSEHLHLKYPNLPNRVLKAAISTYVGPNTLADVATELGFAGKGIMKWDREHKIAPQRSLKPRPATARDILAQAMRAIVGLVFQTKGLAATRSFMEALFLSRLPLPPTTSFATPVKGSSISSPAPLKAARLKSVNTASITDHPLSPLLKFDNPKHSLYQTIMKYGLPPTTSRLIAETGRLSQCAVYGVGIWSGEDKIGEGWSGSIKGAERRAAEDALRRLYLKSSPDLQLDEIPSATLDSQPGFLGSVAAELTKVGSTQSGRDIWSLGEPTADPVSLSRTYRPRPLGEAEVVHGAKR